ncbi:voltage-gated chloride channel family protein [Pedobacter sp. SD-b]|uniref:Voltage-gated chloride channel family protein n=1 Tax=Pedobacter segetis TaxID=2793069 RepID=A0ABS1BFA5_9SPHI|nr:voltage-gated chloride channel family protein [Pedobacter segetis]MBK0381505.1 voltage-gated chloride channel family protein [Pedobacter segetis]
MLHKIKQLEHYSIFKYLIKWLVISFPLGIAIGSMVALFLWLLNSAIFFRFSHTYLIYFLPFAGIAIHFMYKAWGKSSEKGNNLIMDEIHEPGGGVPPQMGPLVLITTVITHLFGGSAGREGTAVQIGGSMAQLFAKWFNLSQKDVKVLLMAGIAAGFGAVFGTPLTGAIFGIEVIALGKLKYDAIIPCLFASMIGDFTVNAWQIKHMGYHIDFIQGEKFLFSGYLHWDLLLIIKIMIAAVAFGLASYIFAEMVHNIKNIFLRFIKVKWLIPFLGGIIIILLFFLVGKPDYLSLGVNPEYPGSITIISSFTHGGADALSWLWKTVFTAITLGTGFKGGEVTPLFYIGSTLGNSLAILMNAPISLFAALGFIAVFAGATNTPLACTVMGVELFGGQYILYFALACFIAYFFSGHSGIYSSQRIGIPKSEESRYANEDTLKDVQEIRDGYIASKLGKYRF